MTTAGNETLTCYVNPNPLTEPSTWAVAATNSQEIAAITGLTLRGNQNTGSYVTYLDNIRLAEAGEHARMDLLHPLPRPAAGVSAP